MQAMGVPEINGWAVALAGLSSAVLGMAWYAPRAFGERSGAARGAGDEAPAQRSLRAWLVITVFSAVSACAFALWLGPEPAMERALLRGGVAGFGFVGASFAIQYQIEERALASWCIDAGYQLARFMLFAVILGAWH